MGFKEDMDALNKKAAAITNAWNTKNPKNKVFLEVNGKPVKGTYSRADAAKDDAATKRGGVHAPKGTPKARASQQYNKGNLTKAEKGKIDRKADRKLGKKEKRKK